jgi:hypothetical protein
MKLFNNSEIGRILKISKVSVYKKINKEGHHRFTTEQKRVLKKYIREQAELFISSHL